MLLKQYKSKIWFIALGFLAVMLAGCGNTSLPTLEDTALRSVEIQQVTRAIYAHRGDRESKPSGWDEQAEWDNSLRAVSLAQANNEVERVEIDLQLNRHPESLARTGGLGIIFVHHDSTCTVVDAQGKAKKSYWFFDETYDVNDDHPDNVNKCAETLEDMLLAFPQGKWVLEMKSGDTALPMVLLAMLQQYSPNAVVSSIDEDLLVDLRNRANAANYFIEYLRVFQYLDWMSQNDIREAKNKGFQQIAFGIDLGTKFTSSSNIAYAKNLGLIVGAWHWQLTSCEDANDIAYQEDLDFMLTDCITDMASHNGW